MLSAYENNERLPTLGTLERLAGAVGLVPVIAFVPRPDIAMARLSDAFLSLPGADEVWLHGSYACFADSEREEVPDDIDVLIIGNVDVGLACKAAREAEHGLGLYVDVLVLAAERWNGNSGFVRSVRSRPLVRIG